MKTEVIFLWITMAGMLILGFLGIVQPEESAIHTQVASSAMLAERIAHMEDILRNESALQEARKRVLADLSHAVTSRHGAQDDAFLLRSIAVEAQRAGVAILSIAPGDAEQSGHAITSRNLLMSVRGRYRSMIAFLPQLSLTDPLLEIQSVAIQAQDQATLLRVDITARLYRIASTGLEGK